MYLFAKIIQKELLQSCSFRKSTVEVSVREMREQSRRIYMAMLLGKSSGNKTRIVFNTDAGYREVCSNIWATTENAVFLTDGNHIPLEAIAEVEFTTVN